MEEKASRFSQVGKEKEISDVVSRLVGQFCERTLVNLVLAVLFGRQPFHDFLQRFDVFLGCLETRQVQFREELWQSRMLDISRCPCLAAARRISSSDTQKQKNYEA